MGKNQARTTADRRQGRLWRFATAEFDERTWTLTVDGRVASIEGKPLELLHELLLRAGEVVTKDELLDAVWPDVEVVEASLPTAVLKLRRALKDDGEDGPQIIETAQRLGYRLAAPVAMEIAASTSGAPVKRESPAPARPARWLVTAVGFALTFALGATLATLVLRQPARATAYTQEDAKNAIRKLDVVRIEELLRAGWNPNTPFDNEGNGALNILLGVCEWNPGHDRARLQLMVKTLLDGGARLDLRNVWGDTPYSIAKAPRYCGPVHPVTVQLRTECYAGFRPLGDRCLANYE